MNYTKIYNNIVNRRKNDIPEGYTEEHHIIPKCLGGTNEKSNLVRLTAKEHFMCHLLLTKMYLQGSNEYYKMCHAFLMMLVCSQEHGNNRYVTSRKYESLKKGFSKRMSVIQGGENNSQYGTKWIYNLQTWESKKIPVNDEIEEGWVKGRKLSSPNNIKTIHCQLCNKEFITKKAKYCSSKCRRANVKPMAPEKKILYGKEREFLDLYREHGSINKAMSMLGYCGAGNYYTWAKNVLAQQF